MCVTASRYANRKAGNGWIGEGGKATLVGAPDADILAAAIEILRK